MKPVEIRCLVVFILSILSFPSFSGSNSEYGDIIRNTPEYNKITNPRNDDDDDEERRIVVNAISIIPTPIPIPITTLRIIDQPVRGALAYPELSILV